MIAKSWICTESFWWFQHYLLEKKRPSNSHCDNTFPYLANKFVYFTIVNMKNHENRKQIPTKAPSIRNGWSCVHANFEGLPFVSAGNGVTTNWKKKKSLENLFCVRFVCVGRRPRVICWHKIIYKLSSLAHYRPFISHLVASSNTFLIWYTLIKYKHFQCQHKTKLPISGPCLRPVIGFHRYRWCLLLLFSFHSGADWTLSEYFLE